MRNSGLWAGLIASVLGVSSGRAQELPKVCSDAQALALGNRFDLAEAYAEQCYNTPRASRDLIIFGRFNRANALMRLERHRDALEQFEFLMQPAYAASPIYDRRANGLRYLGATQAVIAAQAARLSLGFGDADKALAYSQKALKLAAVDPAVHMDVAGAAYMLRARIRASRQDMRGGTIDLVRAFIRGSQDAWVLDNIKAIPAADLETIKGLQTRMLAAYQDYLKIYLVSSMASAPTYLAELKAKGDPLYQAVLADEAAYLGPDT